MIEAHSTFNIMISSIIFTYLAYSPVISLASVLLIFLRRLLAMAMKPSNPQAFTAMLAFYGWILFAASLPGVFFLLVRLYANIFM